MDDETLSVALEREHREIDEGIEAFTAESEAGATGTEPLVRAMAALRRHIYLEEEFLFPPLRSGGLMAPLFVMCREHGQLWQTMEKLEAQLSEDATGPATVALCRELLAQLDAHNSKEEPIIYPQADEALPDAAATEFRELLASGRLPAGWVCQAVRS